MIPKSRKKKELEPGKVKKPKIDEPEEPEMFDALVVSARPEIDEIVCKTLDDLSCYITTWTGHYSVALDLGEHYDFMVIIEDKNSNGLDTLKEIRKVHKTVPILYIAPIAFPDVCVPLVEKQLDAKLNRMGFGIEEDIREMHEDYVAKKKGGKK